MNRRGFFKALGAVAVAAHPVAKLVAPAATPFIERYIHRTYSLAFALTEEVVTEGELANLGSLYAAHLAQSMIETKETLAANILTRAFES